MQIIKGFIRPVKFSNSFLREPTDRRYKVLEFIEEIRRANPEEYGRLKKKRVCIDVVPLSTGHIDGYSTFYSATWGNYSQSGRSELDLGQLEALLEMDKIVLAEEGISMSIQEGQRL